MFSDFHLQASFGGSVNIYTKRSAPFFLFFVVLVVVVVALNLNS